MSVPARPCPGDDDPVRSEIREQALRLVQIASVDVMEHPDDDHRRGLVRILRCARGHQVPIADLCAAAGLDKAHVLELLAQAGDA